MKEKTIFVCNSCGNTSAKWYGRCPACGNWNTLVEEIIYQDKSSIVGDMKKDSKPQFLDKIVAKDCERYQLGLVELDGVLGGGIVPGSSILLGGEPGIGKSTLLLQTASLFGKKHGKVFYITGEESVGQVQMRAKRLECLSENVILLAENNLRIALNEVKKHDIKLLVIDSVQAVYSPELSSIPGSISQVRAVAAACLEFTREMDVTVILVGHVTKEGTLAGPRVLEHMVDTVLYFEGERFTSFRLLRAVKNRFGSTNEIGVFEMGERGLLPFANPSLFFLGQRPHHVAGSAITCVIQGTRPMLLEVQALVSDTNFGNPRRLAVGVDYNRLLIIIAVLEKKLGLPLGVRDVYLNIVGGLKVDDPAADLAIAAAIVSSYKGQPLPDDLLIFGEIGLLGEVRGISQVKRRLKEGEGFGFKDYLLPKAIEEVIKGKNINKVSDLAEALKAMDLV